MPYAQRCNESLQQTPKWHGNVTRDMINMYGWARSQFYGTPRRNDCSQSNWTRRQEVLEGCAVSCLYVCSYSEYQPTMPFDKEATTQFFTEC